MRRNIILLFSALIFLHLIFFVSAKQTTSGSGFECDRIINDVGSIRLIDSSSHQIKVEITANEYIGNSFLGFFHPMKIMTENLAAEITSEEITIDGKIEKMNVYGPEHLNLILGNFYNYRKYPRTEEFTFNINSYDYELHFFLRTKTFADLFSSRCVQGSLGKIEICGDRPNGDCDAEQEATQLF